MGSGKFNGVTSKTILSDDVKREIAERHAGGAGVVELARAYRCRTTQVNLIIRTIGKPRQPLTANAPIKCRPTTP